MFGRFVKITVIATVVILSVFILPSKALADTLPSPEYVKECQMFGSSSPQCLQAAKDIYYKAKFEEKTGIKLGSVFDFISLFIINIVIELIAAIIYIAIRKQNSASYFRLLIAVVVANIITYPIFYIITESLSLSLPIYGFLVMFLEIIIVFFEAFLIFRINKKYFDFKKSFYLSITTNLSSILIGGFVYSLLLNLAFSNL